MSVKSFMRTAKNYAKGYSDIQIKVRTATSNDAWGPSGGLMAEIADATHTHRDFLEIMEMLDKRLNDSGKNWRHVYKSLILLDFLLQNGSEAVYAYTKENLYIVKTLKEFQYIDDEGRDQGINVRQKSKEITTLLNDEIKMRETRAAKKNNTSSSRYRYEEANTSSFVPSGNAEEDLQRAIEESKKTARVEEQRRLQHHQPDNFDSDLQKAIELSEREAIQKRMRQRDGLEPQTTGNSLDGSPAGSPPKSDFIDFFASVDVPQPQQVQQPQVNLSNQFGGQDPFMVEQQRLLQQQQMLQNQLMYQQQQQAMAYPPSQPIYMSSHNPFMNNAAPAVSYPSQPYQQVPPIPQQQQDVNLIKTNATIDPFASLAASRTHSVPAPSSSSMYNPFGNNNQGNANTGTNGLVNLDSLGSVSQSSQLAQENAIKNPFASKISQQQQHQQPQASQPRFQWEPAKPPPMTLAQLSNKQYQSNTMPNLQQSVYPSSNQGQVGGVGLGQQGYPTLQQNLYGIPPPSQQLQQVQAQQPGYPQQQQNQQQNQQQQPGYHQGTGFF